MSPRTTNTCAARTWERPSRTRRWTALSSARPRTALPSWSPGGTAGAARSISATWYTEKQFGDFLFSLGWWCTAIEDNSGVFLRFPNLGCQPASLADPHGYEVQIDERGFDFGPNVSAIP